MKERGHWDVTDKKGNKVKEVDCQGNEIWPKKVDLKKDKEGVYAEYVNHPLWPLIEKAFEELEENSDFKLTTNIYFPVGYFVKEILEKFKVEPKITRSKSIGSSDEKSYSKEIFAKRSSGK